MSIAKLNWDRCEICEKEFKTKSNLKRHVVTVHGGYSVSCKICHVQFSREDNFKKHLLKQHVDNNTSTLCGGRGQVRDEVLETTNPHIESLTVRTTDKGDHLGSDFSFKCIICNNLFKFKHQVENHVLSHCSEENLCKICEKKHTNCPALGIHMNMHAGQRRIKCRECSKYYIQKHTGFAASNSSDDVAISAAISVDQNSVNDAKTISWRPQDQHPNMLNNSTRIKLTGESSFRNISSCDQSANCNNPSTRNNNLITHIENDCQRLRERTMDSELSISILNWDRCEICEKEFKTKSRLKRHVLTVHSGYSVSCKICNVRFSREDNFKKHLLKQHVDNNTSNLCGGCGQVIDEVLETTNPHIERLAIKTTDKGDHLESDFSFKCLICNKLFKFKRQAERHVPSHSTECKICDKKYKDRSNLIFHMRIHAGKRKKKCTECFKYYSGSFETHVSRVHKASGSHIIKCIVCNKPFHNEAARAEHMTVHTGSRMFQCETCGKFYPSSTCLYAHRLRHAEKIPCKQCGKPIRKLNMPRHLECHSDVKAHQCEVCGKGFKHLQNLMTHRLCHSDNRRHCCDLCDNRFKLPHQLRAHKKTHRLLPL